MNIFNNINSCDGAIYVDMFSNTDLSSYYVRVLTACGVRSENGAEIIALVGDSQDAFTKKLCDSHNVSIVRYRYSFLRSQTMKILWRIKLLRNISRDDFDNISFLGNKVFGYDLHDYLIRESISKACISKLEFDDIHLINVYTSKLLWLKKLWNKKPPKYYFVHEYLNMSGAFIELAKEYGAKCYVITKGGRVVYLGGKDETYSGWSAFRPLFVNSWNRTSGVNYVEIADEYMYKRTHGGLQKDPDSARAFSGQPGMSKEEFKKLYPSWDENKKTAVIMTHCISDSAHKAAIYPLYWDFYEWLVETIKIATNIDGVNWFVKPHPSRMHYGEKERNVPLDILKKYDVNKRINYLDDEIKSDSIIDIVDVVITVQGTCSWEYPYYGINAISASQLLYSNVSCVISPKSVEEYEKVLKSISQIEPLGSDDIDKAKRIVAAMQELHGLAFDELDEELGKIDYMDTDQNMKVMGRYSEIEEDTFWYLLGKRMISDEKSIELEYNGTNEAAIKIG